MKLMSRADDLARVDAALTRIGRLVNSRRAARYRQARSGVDLLPTSVATLGAIVRLAPARLTAVAEATDLEPSRVSKEVARLVEAGLVGQEPDPTDRRATLLVVTAEGHEAMRRYRATVEEILAERLSGFRDEDLATLADLMHRLGTALAAEPG